MRLIRIKEITVLLFMAIAIAFAPAVTVAAPTAPNWLPGQPMLAGNQVIAMWLPVVGAVKYNIYLNGAKLLESPANQYIGLAPEAPGKYAYTVAAVDATGAEGPRSPEGVISITKIEPPKEVIFRADPADKSATIRWGNVLGASIYNLYRSSTTGGPYSLVTSTTELAYKDGNLEVGKDYFYTVSAKDVTGKESGMSAEVVIKVEEEEKVGAGGVTRIFNLVVVPSKVVSEVALMDDPSTGERFPIGDVTALRRGTDGKARMINNSDRIVVLTDAFKVEKIIYASPDPKLSLDNTPMLYDFVQAPDGYIYATDRGNNGVVKIDADDGTIVAFFRTRKPTREENEKVYMGIEERKRAAPPSLTTIGALTDGRIVVFDSYGEVYEVMDPDSGKILEWFAFYMDGEQEKRLSNAKDLIGMPDGTLILSLALGRKVVRLNMDEQHTMVWKAGEFGGKVGNFIGMGGATFTPNGSLMITDPTLSTINVYNIENGDYLYSIGAALGKPFAGDPSRAEMDFANPNFPLFINGGKDLAVFPAMDKKFLIRNILGEVPPIPVKEG